jgi:hypothetical protein
MEHPPNKIVTKRKLIDSLLFREQTKVFGNIDFVWYEIECLLLSKKF